MVYNEYPKDRQETMHSRLCLYDSIRINAPSIGLTEFR